MKIFKAEPLLQLYFRNEKFSLVDTLFVKHEPQEPGFYRRMFDEDFARLFRSISHRSSNLFEIVSNDDELMKKLLSNIKTKYTSHAVNETLRELIEEIAKSLIWFGRAYYFLHDDTEQDDIHVVPLSSSGILRLFGRYFQWVPNRSESYRDQDSEELPREIRILDSAKVMRFDMPSSIKSMLSAQNRALSIIDKHRFGETTFPPQATYENPNPTHHFDFRMWRDTQERALYRATKSTGWNGRNYDSTKRSDFFDCHRLIRFRRNQVLLRDDILKQLSNELSRVGKSYKAEFKIEISGSAELPSIAHLNELEMKLSREEVGFDEIIDYCYKC